MGTLTAAWNAGVISGNDTLTAQSIQFKDSNPINDWWGDASPMALTAVEALQYSSNTYMMQLAMRMLGAPYTAANQFLDDTNRVKVYEQFRKAFASYGLGASTGFDLSLIHISEPTRRTPISYAVFCLKKKKKNHHPTPPHPR